MAAAASLHAPTADAAQLAEPQPANNNCRSCPEVGLGAHDASAHDNEMPAQSSAHVSPAMRLYRHALESIFAMLELRDLSRVLAVSRSWSAAVHNMKSIDATIERTPDRAGHMDPVRLLPPIDSLVASPLLKHVTAIRIKDRDNRATPLTSQSLALLTQHAPHLMSLWCDLALTPDTPLLLPAKLSSLELELGDEYAGAEINAVFIALAALPSLSRLILTVQTVDGVDLSLLAASRTLTDVFLGHFDLSDAQVEQIRSSLGHLRRIRIGTVRDLPRLLQPPVTACWQDLGSIFADADTGDLLVALPTLTKLDLHFDSDAPHADFLSKLPLLSVLNLSCMYSIPAATLLASLLPCTGLTELGLRCAFNSAHVSALLATLTNLRRLKLEVTLDSLRCFASGPDTLEELCISQWGPLVPQSELIFLYALQGLRSLELSGVFASLDADALAIVTPPTAYFPRLTLVVHHSADRNPVKRTGPSFEWMQQRLTC